MINFHETKLLSMNMNEFWYKVLKILHSSLPYFIFKIHETQKQLDLSHPSTSF